MKLLENFKKMGKRDKVREIIIWFIRLLCISYIVYASYMLITKKNVPSGRVANINISGILQADLLFAATFLPLILEKIIKIKLPFYIVFVFLAFALGALWCGEINDFYIRYSWWDDVLHTISGFYIAAIGFFVISIINEKRSKEQRLGPGFVQLFSFILAIASEAVWEIFEFSMDSLFKTNMQRAYESESFKNNGPVDNISDPNFNALVGRDALIDTMGDMIEVLIGAFIMCIIGYILLKYERDKESKKIEESINLNNCENKNTDNDTKFN